MGDHEQRDCDEISDDDFDRALGEQHDSDDPHAASEGLRDVEELDADDAMGPS